MTQPFEIEDGDLDAGEEFAQSVPTPPARSRLSGLAQLSPRTLTARLAIGVVALLVVLISITATVTYLSLKPFLYDRLDKQVSTTAAENATSIQQSFEGPGGGSQIVLVYTGERLWFTLVHSDGSIPRISITPKERNQFALMSLSADRAQSFIAHPGKTVSLSSGGEPLHVQSVALQDGNYVVIGLSTREVERTLHRLVLLELIIGIAVIAIAAAATVWGVRAGLRPLRRVTLTAQEVTAELGPDGAGLDRRVPMDGATVEVEQVASSVNTLLHTVQTEFAARLRSEERMRQFLADASHELRTPLTSIRGYAELSRLQGRSSDDPDDSMRRIEVEGTRMSRLVEDLLVLARGDQDNMLRREPVPVDRLLTEAAAAVHSAHPDREFSIGESGGAIVIGDWDQLLRVLINLAGNAAVHTAPGGPIRLEAAAGRTPMGAVVALRVIDAGPGLPPEEAAHVFERFWRADKARTRAKGGSGLGMAIVAQIVAAHGGSVHFDSAVETGTTVTVLLPAAPPAGYAPGHPPASPLQAPVPPGPITGP